MYPVSEAFLRAAQGNIRRYYWTEKITTEGGAVYDKGVMDSLIENAKLMGWSGWK